MSGRSFNRDRALKVETAYGCCECGCGQRTTICERTHTKYGWVKGNPRRFILGHSTNGRGHGPIENRYRVEDRGYETPCWIWIGSTNGIGYGRLERRRKQVYAHRFMWERRHGPIPPGLQMDHLCRITLCVNPDHLEAVSQAENLRRGDGTRLSEWQVRAMRRAREEVGLTTHQLAEAFGVAEQTIQAVLSGRTWREIR